MDQPESKGTKIKILSVCLAFAVGGCATVHVRDQVQLFREKHREEAQQYTVLAPVSVEYIEHVRPDVHADRRAVIHNLETAQNDPAHIGRYLEYLRGVEAAAQQYRIHWIGVTNRLRPTDAMYFFQYQSRIGDAMYGDYGLLVLRDGEIVYRSTFGAQFTGHTNSVEAYPNMDVDRL